MESTRNHSCNKTIRQTDILSDHVSNLLFHTRPRTPSPSFPTPSHSKAFWASDSDGHVTHTGHKTPTGRTLRFPFVSRHPEGEDVTSPSSSANQTFLITPPPLRPPYSSAVVDLRCSQKFAFYSRADNECKAPPSSAVLSHTCSVGSAGSPFRRTLRPAHSCQGQRWLITRRSTWMNRLNSESTSASRERSKP